MITLSPYIVVVVVAWIMAQGLKYAIATLRNRRFTELRFLYLSGNMPSAHTASVVALACMIGFTQGVDSAIFGLAALFAAVVMYDAVMVRRSSGEQGLALRQLLTEQKSTILLPRAAKGHTPLEVLAGAILGVVISIVVFLATK